MINYYCAPDLRYEMMAGVRPSVRLSVACLDLNGKRKTGRMEANLEVKGLKVKVTKRINAVTDNAPYAGWGHCNFLKISLLLLLLLLLFFSPSVIRSEG